MNELTAFDFEETGMELLVDVYPGRNTVSLYFGRPVAALTLTGANAERLGGLLTRSGERCGRIRYSGSDEEERSQHKVL